MRNNEIIFKRVRELASNNCINVIDIYKTEAEFICIEVDDISIPYKYLMELDSYLDQWNMIVISIDIDTLSGKGITIWLG